MSTENDLDILNREIAAIRKERADVFERIAPLQKQVVDLYNEMKDLQERRDKIRVEEMRKTGPDFKSMVQDVGGGEVEGRSSSILYNYFSQEVSRLGGYHSGFWGDTGDANIKVQLSKGGTNLQKTLELVKLFVPLMKPHTYEWDRAQYKLSTELMDPDEGGGMVWFGIFESSLSASGTYRLDVAPDFSKARVGYTRWGYRLEQEFASVEDALKYIADVHPYGRYDEEE